jgi:hypothetical protein
MAAPPPETIPATRITTAVQTFGPFGPYSVDIGTAEIVIDRTVNGGLNSVAAGSTLDLTIDYSVDGGAFSNCGGIEAQGGLIVTKGVTLTQDTLTVRRDAPFPANRTRFQVTAVASTAVRIAGTVDYT